nr:MAG TPA: hypothetical protein [Caudoviricetes sp.]
MNGTRKELRGMPRDGARLRHLPQSIFRLSHERNVLKWI